MSNTFYLITVLILVLNTINAKVIITSNGPVRGSLVTHENVSYIAYRGIPYAENPTGALRFQPPVTKKKWTHVLNASSNGPVCIQPEGAYKKHQMGEDCLRINVYVPVKKTNTSHLPVFAFIHGGAYRILSKDSDVIYDPYFFMKKGIIVVTMNYRLGALGFLSLKTPGASGNNGLKDLVLALQWVKENICKFGGDSTKITVGGNSSGSSMANYLMLSRKTTGLIHRVIMFSGSALNFRFLQRYPIENARELASGLGLSINDSDVLLQNLKTVNPFDIVDAQENMYKKSRNPIITFAPFVPTIEPDSADAFLTEDPTSMVKKGLIQNVPVLAGINSLEGITFYHKIVNNKTLLNDLENNIHLTVPNDIEYPRNSTEFRNLVQSIKELYFNSTDTSALNKYFRIFSDIAFTHKVDYFIYLHKRNPQSNKVFYYEFDFDGDLNWGKLYHDIQYPGTCHSDELGYLFVTNATKENLKTLDNKSRHVLNIMVSVMSNFIKFGNPTPSCDMGICWTESNCSRNHIVLKEIPVLKNNSPYPERFTFWSEVYKQFYKYVRDGGKLTKILA
ncbi:juvenile hormone esterase [Bombyx mori]|uniref:Carboxylic ester hydrolase n=1 Tax=Bombyx mori TaxID=7091 RepID=A0A8R2LYB7_BOMMO|nr:juvenile hormone esterase-like [Bombyx mori]XP_037868237.1 juvenile hormone esterase-like [Bombyx mori]XP_037868238.1 juvenile hormone esterase-like [Bombyx mori]XP_037868239.1 juvenile hormone esterase-like [Bombyx mori]